MKTLEQRACEFATKAHERIGQKRKYTEEPYINHPMSVVEIVRSVPHDEEMLAAAWLHDTVEDTETPLEDIEAEFGTGVADLVSDLTYVSKPLDGDRKTRKAIDRQHTASASIRAKTIKLADLIDNSKSIRKHDPEFAVVYLEEKRLLLELLSDGDITLWWRAKDIVDGSK